MRNVWTMHKKKMFLAACLLGILLFLDQGVKWIVVLTLKGTKGIVLIPGILEFCYVENPGAAWGILSGKSMVLILVTVCALLFLGKVYFTLCADPHFFTGRVLIVFLMAGALGNMIDRISLGYVIDFIYFRLIDFPVFNVADCFVTVPIVLGILIYRKELWEWTKNG